MGEGPPLWLVGFTLAIYAGFLVAYSQDIVGGAASSDATCNGPISCATTIFHLVVDLFDFLTLGGLNSPLTEDLPVFGGILQAVLVLFMAITWGVVIAGILSEAVGAVAGAL